MASARSCHTFPVASGPAPIVGVSLPSQSQNAARQMKLARRPTGISRLSVEGCFGLLLKSNQDFSLAPPAPSKKGMPRKRSEEHTSELQSRQYLVCRLLLEKKKKNKNTKKT